mgnify:CR=1 FL=1
MDVGLPATEQLIGGVEERLRRGARVAGALGAGGPDEAEDFLNPLRLLAKAIAFTDPVTGEARAFESPRALDWPS